MTTYRAFIGLSLVLAAACSSGRDGGRPGPTGPGTSPGPGTGTDAATGTGTDGGTIDPNGCSAAAQLVYLIDQDTTLYSFDPTTSKFTTIGQINCPADFGDSPFSMGVDRSATAWVLFSSGNVFKVSTTDASCTTSTRQVGQDGLTNFGMGFASNSVGSTDDTLYVIGGAAESGSSIDTNATSTFATMTAPGMTATTIATIKGWPELTGNDNGELWGFFPADTGTPKVAMIDKTSGAFGTTYMLGQLAGTPQAWAFAHYGGDYYVFLMRESDNSTGVYKVSGTDGTMTTLIGDSGKTIVGAGVSTCAPVTIN
jgi:hypothetical protein